MSSPTNPLSLRGIAFIEFCSPDPAFMDRVFRGLGFSLTRRHRQLEVDLYQQNQINFLINRVRDGAAASFSGAHGPAVSGLGFYVDNAERALEIAVSRGAEAVEAEGRDLPYAALRGIGGSLIYLVDGSARLPHWQEAFVRHPEALLQADRGFICVDHLTNNVYKGTMEHWSDFYRNIFGFTEVRRFDITGKKTGLLSYALRSPDGSFCIPINEGKETASQIDEYLREYHGPGVQHIALLSESLLDSLDSLDHTVIPTLDIDEDYYSSVFERVHGVREDHDRIRDHQVLVDGDERGYLLQIFTRNLFGPIFFEMIQRRAHQGFGEGNFQALFESIERDQQRRGVL